MTDSPYHDPRAAFWRSAFEQASEYATYLAESPEHHAAKWHEMATHLPAITDQQRQRLTGYNRRMHVLVSSGVWCGDCVRQVPMIENIAQAAGEEIVLHIIDRDVNPDLREELRVVGAERVPMAVFLSEDFWELGRYGDRSLTAYRGKATREVGAACALGVIAPPTDELAAEQAEWIDVFERMLLMVRLS
ncbi:MAG: thioredoxin family protein, partial [Phycisphaeraceae bacterium]